MDDEGSPPLKATLLCHCAQCTSHTVWIGVLPLPVAGSIRNLHVSTIASWQGFTSQMVYFPMKEGYFIRRLSFITQSIITLHIKFYSISMRCIYNIYIYLFLYVQYISVYINIYRCIHMNILVGKLCTLWRFFRHGSPRCRKQSSSI